MKNIKKEENLQVEKHKAIIYGYKARLTYYASSYSDKIVSSKENIEKIIIFEGDIDNPPLGEQESVYIPNLKIAVFIDQKSRNLDGGFVYYTSYVAELIEDDVTTKSKDDAEKELDQINLKKQEERKAFNIKKEKQNKWYRKMFKKKK